MNQFKRANVIMLPTNNNLEFPYVAQNVFNKQLTIVNSTFAINCELQNQHLYIISDDQIKEGDWFYSKTNNIINNNYNLFIKRENHIISFKKIIGTTDTSLKISKFSHYSQDLMKIAVYKDYLLPQLSQQFIEKYIKFYNKNEVITDVLIDYEDYILQHMFKPQEYKQRIKINPKNNTITIKKLKNNWNRKEIVELIEKVFDDCTIMQHNSNIQPLVIVNKSYKDWIKNNL